MLTVLSYGGGQDSTALLYKYIHDNDFLRTYALGHFLVIMADTGDEHAHTYEHVQFTKELCAEHGIEFVHLTSDMGYHTGDWKNLRHFYRVKKAVGSKCFPKVCTDRLKLQPIYRFLEYWIEREYGFPAGRKAGLKQFAQRHGKIQMLIGIARGEEKRVKGNRNEPKWREASIQVRYPLIDMGMDRQDCQVYVRSLGLPVPYPSNCILCPFMSEIELVWLYRNLPEDYTTWVAFEAAKLERCAHNGDMLHAMNAKGQIVDNMGVWGMKWLPEVLSGALKKYGEMSLEELDEYKMNHGCNMSKY
jgi:3'-phosphoadenosine 5'-phosphosulfate sulfotransferase (PAPS reductase)/FAD synthetase